jgi:hypothetical protein
MKAIVALMEFGYPKARIDHVGDAPTGAVVENSFKFVLNISDEPQRPVPGNGYAAAAGAGEEARVIDAAPDPAHRDD